MPALRPLLVLAAAVTLTTGCTSTIAGAGSPAAGITRPRSPAPTPHPTYNGVASMTGDEALGTAYDALLHAATVRVKAAFIGVADPWTFDLRYRGTNSDGIYVVGGMIVQIRKIGRSVYQKADQDYWRSALGPAANRVPSDKWIKVPITENSVKDIADLLQQDRMAGVIGLPGTLSTGVFRTVNGVEAVPVLSDGRDKATVYVAITGKPYPVRLETGTDLIRFDFLDYGRPVTITAPPASQVAEFDTLPTS